MKQQLLLFFILFCTVSFHINAQSITYKGKSYQVKGESIYMGSYDVTESLTLDDQREIKAAYAEQEDAIRQHEKALKQEDKAERKRKKQEAKVAKKAQREVQPETDSKASKKFLIF